MHAPGMVPAHNDLELPGEVRISHFDNEVPAFAGPEIDRLYGHLYCSPSYFEVANELGGASTYVAQKSGVPVAVLLYRLTGHEVTVLNDYAAIDAEEIRRFADYIFNVFEAVKVVSFRKIRAGLLNIDRPRHAINCIEDLVVSLPQTVKEYDAALGRNMRRNIKRNTNALLKDYPSYRFQFYHEGDISEQHVRDIVSLSCLRMKSKNIEPRFNEEETRWIIDYAQKCGIAGVATIDGRVCAGIIGFRIGQGYFMHVIAHDLRFNEYSLGILCCYHAICEAIVRGAKRCHLLQGRYGYKYRLLAERRDIVHLDIYRNRLCSFLNGRRALHKEIKGRIWLGKQWLLHDVEQKDGPAYRYVASAIGFLRRRKRSKGQAESS